MLARHNVTNKLHQFAQKLDICLLGIRNEDTDGRAYGPASMSDIGRCVLRAVELDPDKKTGMRYCVLMFPKVTDTARSNYPSIPYAVPAGDGAARSILWGIHKPEPPPPLTPEQSSGLLEAMKARHRAATAEPGANGCERACG